MSIGIKLGIFSELDAAAAGGGDGGWDGEPGTILLTPSADGSTSDWTLAQGSSKWEVVGIASGSSDGSGAGGGDSGWGAYSGDRICYPANLEPVVVIAVGVHIPVIGYAIRLMHIQSQGGI